MAKDDKKRIDKDKLKNGVIIALILIVVLGGSYLVSELKGNNNDNNTKSTELDSKAQEAGELALDAQTEAAAISDDEKKEFNQISVEEYLNLKEGKKASIIYIARPTCTYCTYSTPILQNIAYQYDLTINYINTDEVSDAESIDIINSDDYFSDGVSTPTVLIVKNDKIIDVYEGLTTKAEYVSFFKENGMIS